MNGVIVWLGPEVLLSLLPKSALDYTLQSAKCKFARRGSIRLARCGLNLARSFNGQERSLKLQPTRLQFPIADQRGWIGF